MAKKCWINRRNTPEYISPQVKILKYLFKVGGKATTKEIANGTNLTVLGVHNNGRHLVVYRTVKKKFIIEKVPKRNIPYTYSIWQLNKCAKPVYEGRIKKAYGEEGLYNDRI